ncbi:hypothetical protein YK56LOC_02870 [Caballeronia sp. HLA56]
MLAKIYTEVKASLNCEFRMARRFALNWLCPKPTGRIRRASCHCLAFRFVPTMLSQVIASVPARAKKQPRIRPFGIFQTPNEFMLLDGHEHASPFVRAIQQDQTPHATSMKATAVHTCRDTDARSDRGAYEEHIKLIHGGDNETSFPGLK